MLHRLREANYYSEVIKKIPSSYGMVCKTGIYKIINFLTIAKPLRRRCWELGVVMDSKRENSNALSQVPLQTTDSYTYKRLL
ncbi:MAG: hypothetical protein ABIO81_05760, partial [Ginsengibacter sp.]